MVLQKLYIFIFSLDLFLCLVKKSQQLRHRHLFVYLWSILYFFSWYTKSQWRYCFSYVVRMRWTCNNQTGFWIASQRFLKHSGQFTFPVRNMRGFSIRERIDNFSKRSQTCIDFFCLIKGFSLGTRFWYLLTSCQINQIQFSSFSTQICSIILTNRQDKDHMGPGWPFVHVGTSNRTTISSNFN